MSNFTALFGKHKNESEPDDAIDTLAQRKE